LKNQCIIALAPQSSESTKGNSPEYQMRRFIVQCFQKRSNFSTSSDWHWLQHMLKNTKYYLPNQSHENCLTVQDGELEIQYTLCKNADTHVIFKEILNRHIDSKKQELVFSQDIHGSQSIRPL
jgi:hypothetical protein